MATVLNRTTKALLVSVNTVDYPTIDWIIEPDLSAVAGFASKYWTITGDTVSLLDQAGRNAVDAAILSAQRDAIAAAMNATEDYARAFALVVLDEINLHATRITAILDAVDGANSLATLKTAVAAIADVPQRTIDQLKTALRNKLGS
jgi:hypothetical protein